MFYPSGDHSNKPVPGSINYIVAQDDGEVVYVIRRQQPSGAIDPFSPYPHFHAKIYSTTLSEILEVVKPEWVLSHYARWDLDEKHAVVLSLSRVCSILYFNTFKATNCNKFYRIKGCRCLMPDMVGWVGDEWAMSGH